MGLFGPKIFFDIFQVMVENLKNKLKMFCFLVAETQNPFDFFSVKMQKL